LILIFYDLICKNYIMLRDNQKNAIQVSLKNNFDSGIHFHATGTGKSWIALELILEYQKKIQIVQYFGYVKENLF
jgi:superfamily II DNA or RNA helicase